MERALSIIGEVDVKHHRRDGHAYEARKENTLAMDQTLSLTPILCP